MRREATRRPLEQLSGALRRCYALVTACQNGGGGYLGRLFWGTRMAAEQEIDMFIRLVPLIARVDTTHDRGAKVRLYLADYYCRIVIRSFGIQSIS